MMTAIDLFAGAGGATEGMERAGVDVIAAINHDSLAIESHRKNHPRTKHFVEDIRLHDEKILPKKVWAVWISAECTHYSIAKGGDARDADSRTLSWELLRYIKWCNPDKVFVENVEEFLSWGPLDENGKPLKKKNGRDYIRWVKAIQALGYNYEYRVLNSADFGAYTSRSRYFGIFARKGSQIYWPAATHAKNPSAGSLFKNPIKPWKPVKDVLDLEDMGRSILFEQDKVKRGKALSPNTLARIEYGLNKYRNEGEVVMNHNYSNSPQSTNEPLGTILASRRHWYKVNMIDTGNFRNCPSPIDSAAPTIMAKRDQYLQTAFLAKYYSSKVNVQSIGHPLHTIPTVDRFALMNAKYLVKKYSAAHNVQGYDSPLHTIMTYDQTNILSVDYLVGQNSQPSAVYPLCNPMPTLTTIPGHRICNVQFINYQYGNVKSGTHKRANGLHLPLNTITTFGTPNLVKAEFLQMQYGRSNSASIYHPALSITGKPKHNLVHARFFEMQYGTNGPSAKYNSRSILAPAGTISTNDKHNLICAIVEDRYKSDRLQIRLAIAPSIYIPGTKVIGYYRVSEEIADIKMRMLHVKELKKAQGFPDDYILMGNTNDKKKFIGNSVVPDMAFHLTQANLPANSKRIAV